MMNNLKRAIDTDLSSLRVNERQRAEILENAMEGKKVKKKVSIAFVLVMTLVLAVAVALAFTISQQYFEGVAQLEAAHGYYDEWSLKEKVEMLNLMKEYNVISDTTEVDALLSGSMSDEEREQKIDTFMVDRYGIDGRMDVITLAGILDHELGTMDTWTQEQKVWYSQMLIDTGLMGSDDDVYQMPTESDVTPDEAIRIAGDEIKRVWSMTDDALAEYTPVWEFRAHISEKDNPFYDIRFEPKSGEGRNLYCSVGRDGRLLTGEDALGVTPRRNRRVGRRKRLTSTAL